MNAWDQIKQYLEAKVSLDAYRNWIQRTGLLTQDGTTLRVAVPDDVTKDWLEQEYADRHRLGNPDLVFTGQIRGV